MGYGILGQGHSAVEMTLVCHLRSLESGGRYSDSGRTQTAVRWSRLNRQCRSPPSGPVSASLLNRLEAFLVFCTQDQRVAKTGCIRQPALSTSSRHSKDEQPAVVFWELMAMWVCLQAGRVGGGVLSGCSSDSPIDGDLLNSS